MTANTDNPKHKNWEDLPKDALSLIFHKLGAIGILCFARAVCSSWRLLAFDPQFFRCIDLRCSSLDFINYTAMQNIVREAINRSNGQVEDFHVGCCDSDFFLTYLAQRCNRLRCLDLMESSVTWEILVNLVSLCPLLEEIHLNNWIIPDEAVGELGQACPQLKCFKLDGTSEDANLLQLEYYLNDSDSVAMEIANNMPQLRELQLINNPITNMGVEAILAKCIHLESLDIRGCFNIVFDPDLQEKIAKIKTVRLPNDGMEDKVFVME